MNVAGLIVVGEAIDLVFAKRKGVSDFHIVASRTLMEHIGLGHELAVPVQPLILHTDAISRQPDGPLDVMLGGIFRVAEDDDVAVPHPLKRKQRFQPSPRMAIDKLVDQKVVSNQKIVLHGGCRNLECLDHEGRSEKRQNDGHHETFEVFTQGRLPGGMIGVI